MGFRNLPAIAALAAGAWVAAAVWSAGMALDDARGELSSARSAAMWNTLALEEVAADVATLVKGTVR